MKFYKIMTLLALTMSPFMLCAGIFDNIENAEQISKVNFDPESLKGKVIFFEYWGVYCPPCKASFPHLVDLQKQYAKTGKFTIIASHVQSDKEKAISFLKFSKVNFPVFQQFRSKEAPCGNGIPHAFLIDHTGKIVAQGHPATLYDKVKELIKNAPAPPSPLLKGVELNYWKNLEKDILKTKSYASLMKNLKKSSQQDTPKGNEAKQIITVFEANLEKKFENLKEASNENPFGMMNEIQKFASKTKGMTVGNSANTLYLEMKSDPYLKKVQKFQKEVDKIIMKIRGHRSKVLFKKAKTIKIKLHKLQEDKMASDRAKKAAQNLIDYIDNQI